MMLKVFYLIAAALVVTNALSFGNRHPKPAKECQKWCPRPGQFGQYDCCDNQDELCADNWVGLCIDGLKRFPNGTLIGVGGCNCAEIKATGWCDVQGTEYCRKTCGYCGDLPTTGQCPETSGIIGICAITPDNCFTDSECSKGTRCCSYGCGRRCLPVV